MKPCNNEAPYEVFEVEHPLEPTYTCDKHLHLMVTDKECVVRKNLMGEKCYFIKTVVLLLAALILTTGCASMTSLVHTLSNIKAPTITVSSAQYTGQIRPLVVLGESLCAAKLTPAQIKFIGDLLAQLDAQAAQSPTIDVLPALVAVAGPLVANYAGQHVSLTAGQQQAAVAGLALLQGVACDNSTVKALAPIMGAALAGAVVK